MRSDGWIARNAGCAPRNCPGRARGHGIPAISRTWCCGWPSAPTAPRWPPCCAAGWETVTAIINRGVAELLDARRLESLYRIGVDEVCYRHPHRYLIVVGDHDTGTVVAIQPGRSEQSLANFYEGQPDSIVSGIEVVSMDVSKAYRAATRTHAPHATICYDPFHIAMGQPCPG